MEKWFSEKKIDRNYLEINSVKELIEPKYDLDKYSFELVRTDDFQLNRFFYKEVGRNHNWLDRLNWTDEQWIKYISDKKIKTYVLKKNQDLAGYFELILHYEKNEVEIAYLGLLEEYHNKKIGSHLLTLAIKNSFNDNPNRVWVHTCSLDHKNALNNYISRGMKIFKRETVVI